MFSHTNGINYNSVGLIPKSSKENGWQKKFLRQISPSRKTHAFVINISNDIITNGILGPRCFEHPGSTSWRRMLSQKSRAIYGANTRSTLVSVIRGIKFANKIQTILHNLLQEYLYLVFQYGSACEEIALPFCQFSSF